MRYDADTLQEVERGAASPTLRFFRFNKPTVSYGRLQKREDIAPLAPSGWDLVRRPTGGGLVFHEQDLCLSLCWPRGEAPLPVRVRDQYQWIHSVLLEAMGSGLRLASCCDSKPDQAPFKVRDCFTHAVGFDVMKADQKIVGGALSCHKEAILYQGSIQTQDQDALELRIQAVFNRHLL